ncbi:S41 family peptidase [Acinetobacter boissieri]|uniref:Peptidase family S41 n=1 Tax=Acinetobacter boissieri TaxID=1219383 RepID=A0A1G6JJS6_9GAMM|nr:S41 family peptidase [Acinetobacter boissieri]SDC18705.1 Peptidase family S41 [Acinetobacter boissieri]
MFKKNHIFKTVFLMTTTALMMNQMTHATDASTTMTPAECLQDLNFTAQFLLDNDAGIKGQRWESYPENIQKILEAQKEKVVDVKTIKECRNIANPFLNAIRKGHIGLNGLSIKNELPKTLVPEKEEIVTTQKLSELTSYIAVPSFGLSVKKQLESLIANNQDNILHAKYLILDLRKNGGGFDDAAEPLYKLLGEAEYWSEVPQIYISPANIQAYKDLRNSIPNAELKAQLAAIIKKMQSKKNGWTYMTEDDTALFSEKITKKDVLASPVKVVVLTDENCGSSGEEFVKSVRQNPRVVTMGQNTYGTLDASNVREKQTPSKKLYVWYATTYVHRRAGQEIDNIGIPPSIKLPKPVDQQAYDNEVKLAQNYLENVK